MVWVNLAINRNAFRIWISVTKPKCLSYLLRFYAFTSSYLATSKCSMWGQWMRLSLMIKRFYSRTMFTEYNSSTIWYISFHVWISCQGCEDITRNRWAISSQLAARCTCICDKIYHHNKCHVRLRALVASRLTYRLPIYPSGAWIKT